jgi:hypothetical protein
MSLLFVASLPAECRLSWTADSGLPPPAPLINLPQLELLLLSVLLALMLLLLLLFWLLAY